MKRQRNVMPTSEIVHLWAHGIDENREIRNPGGSVYAYGDCIYSYGSHFPMAQRIEGLWYEWEIQSKNSGQWDLECTESSASDARAQLATYRENVETPLRIKRKNLIELVYLYNPATYSVTTSSHQSMVRGAIPTGALVIALPPRAWHLVERGKSGKDVRKWFIDRRTAVMTDAHNRRMGFYRRNAAVDEYIELGAQWAKLHRLMRFTCSRNLPVIDPPDLDVARAAHQAQEDARAAQYERERELRAGEESKLLDAWRAGEYKGTLWNIRPDAVRIVDVKEPASGVRSEHGGRYLETSRGSRIAMSEVRRFIVEDLVQVLARPDYMHPVNIGPFRGVLKCDAGLRVGCHLFSMDEVRSVARACGLDLAAVEAMSSVRGS